VRTVGVGPVRSGLWAVAAFLDIAGTGGICSVLIWLGPRTASVPMLIRSKLGIGMGDEPS
jgi:hypothetical protein